MRKSRIDCEIDLTREGRQTGFLRYPYSTHESAYGWLPIPIVSLRNGSGPTILVIGGNHGDEYEGQITVARLCRELPIEAVSGHVILLPLANLPAALAGRRVSPLDQANLNRSFPGDPDGGPTAAIAFHIETELVSRAEVVIDLHSGGSSLEYIPSALVHGYADPHQHARALRLLEVFGAPIGYVVQQPQGEDRTLIGAADRRGIPAMGAELGGGGAVSVASARIAYEGTCRVLAYLGVASIAAPAPGPVRLLDVGGSDYYVYAPEDGVFEPLVDLGDEVVAGGEAGRIHFPDTPWRDPVVTHFARAGVVFCRRVPARTRRGDCLFHLGTDRPS
jgi:predicted deacylase